MTDRQLFMDKLRLALHERGVSDEDAAFYLNDRFYDILAKDSPENTELDKVDLMADGIAAQIKDRNNPDGVERPESSEDVEESEAEGTESELTPNDAPTTENSIPPEILFESPENNEERTVTIDAVIDEIIDEAQKEATAKIDILPHAVKEEPVPAEQTQTVDTVVGEIAPAIQPPLSEYDAEYSDYLGDESEYGRGEQNGVPDYAEELPEEFDLDGDFQEILADDAPSSRLPDYVEEQPIPNSKLFWVLFGVSSPVWIALLIVGLSLFVSAWAALGLLIGASIAAMVAVVAAGSAAALMGIIYGIIEVLSPETFSMGIYNIALGIISTGVTMLAAILIYNFALRLLPWVIKLVGKLFRFTLKKLKQLFNHARRECAKQ